MTSKLSKKVSLRTNSVNDVCSTVAGSFRNWFWVGQSNTPANSPAPDSDRHAAARFIGDVSEHLGSTARQGEHDPGLAVEAALRRARDRWEAAHPGAVPPLASVAVAVVAGDEVRLYRTGGCSVEVWSPSGRFGLHPGGGQSLAAPLPEGPTTVLLYSGALGGIPGAGDILAEQGTWAALRALRATGSEDDVAMAVAHNRAS